MAEVLGVNVTKYDAGTFDSNWIDQGLVKSSVKVWSEVYEAAAVGVADTIVVAVLPAGAVVHGIALQFDALGAGVTLDAGDVTVPARYKSAIVTTSAGDDNSILVDGAQYVITDAEVDGRVLLTVGVGAATGTIKTAVYYTN